MSDETTAIEVPETPVASPESTQPTAPEGAAPEAQTTEEEQPWRKPKLVPLTALHEERGKARALREERDYYRTRFEESQRGATPPEQPRQADPSKPLNPADFQSAEEFATALEERATQKALSKFREETHGATQNQAIEKATSEYTERITSAASRVPDIVERAQWLENEVSGRLDPAIGMELVTSPHAADLIVALTSDPNALRSIMDPNPIRAAKALALLENRVSSQSTQPNPPAARAPVPVTKTVSGASAATKTPEEMTDREWYESRGFKFK